MFRTDAEITCLADLLRALGLADIWELSALVQEHVRLPAAVSHAAGSLVLEAGGRRAPLDYPFSLLAFWVAVRDLDEDATGLLDDCGRADGRHAG